MHVVVIHGWKEETTGLIQALAAAAGITLYEMRQRMIGGGPAVVANFADRQPALAMAARLDQCGVATLIVDSGELCCNAGRFVVRRFEMKELELYIEANDGQSAGIPYDEIDLLLPGIRILGETETKTVTERKFDLGRTILSGGIPLTRKVEHQEELNREIRDNVLCLYADERPPVFFSQSSVLFEGLGAAMKLSRELNFAYLKSELRRLCRTAIYDDRLLNRLGQLRLLGPAQNPETNLDLSFDILASTLRRAKIAG
ncbi:MAG: hypothetical protein PHD54_08505 [Desulfuromonadaceae bacterium]|nr:hypothetical protein [Desulfuromonadaceae bacterium]